MTARRKPQPKRAARDARTRSRMLAQARRLLHEHLDEMRAKALQTAGTAETRQLLQEVVDRTEEPALTWLTDVRALQRELRQAHADRRQLLEWLTMLATQRDGASERAADRVRELTERTEEALESLARYRMRMEAAEAEARTLRALLSAQENDRGRK